MAVALSQYSLNHIHTYSLSLSHTRIHIHSHTLSLFLSQSHTHTHSLSLSLTHRVIHLYSHTVTDRLRLGLERIRNWKANWSNSDSRTSRIQESYEKEFENWSRNCLTVNLNSSRVRCSSRWVTDRQQSTWGQWVNLKQTYMKLQWKRSSMWGAWRMRLR